ncbi:MAG: hypothetical protein AAF171_03105 [Cyanobacteria bacterium P01_A01_bin.116]
MSNGTIPTPEQNTQAIAQLTAAVDVLVSQFIRPNAQQANANRESLDEVVELLNRHARAIVEIDEQQQANAQQIAATGDWLEQFDSRLDETRQLVAKNASNIAQLTVKQDRNAGQIAALGIAQRENATQIEAIAELTRTQLAGIIGNGRRIDRLEQQAS